MAGVPLWVDMGLSSGRTPTMKLGRLMPASSVTKYIMNILFIDTTSNKEIIVRLTVDGKDFEEKRAIENNRTQIVLPLIDQLLKEHNLSPKDLNAIEVNEGPGSFTGVRVGVSIANTLSFALQIPVNGITLKENGKLVEPNYG